MKLFKKIHLWLSVPFGIIVTLICFSGAMLAFEQEITRAIRHDVYYVDIAQSEPLPLDILVLSAEATLSDGVYITGITAYPNKNRTYMAELSQPANTTIFVNQYTGRITGEYYRLGFFTTMFKLHRWLLDSADPHGDGVKVGKLIVGISVIAFVFVLITGIILWCQRARKGLKRSLTITKANGLKVFLKGLHVAGGMYAVLIVLTLALTGLTWSFGWYKSAFYAVCGVEMPVKSARADKGGNKNERTDTETRIDLSHWQQVYEELKEHDPRASQISLSDGSASVLHGCFGNIRATDKYTFESSTGDITSAQRYEDSSDADKLRGWIYSIHTGGIGGYLTRLLWFCAALLGMTLPLTGYYIWIKHLLRKKSNTPQQ